MALSFSGKAASSSGQAKTLSFAERVTYQRAIEDVYWHHRIWPKERPDPKPSLDPCDVSGATGKESRGLPAPVSSPRRITGSGPFAAEQLQAEMDRMAKHTKQPEVLRDLFEALGNDPFVIAECLARPALADRLLTNWYSYDQRIHGDLEQRAKSELQAHNTVGQMKQLSGTYSEVELVKSDTFENL